MPKAHLNSPWYNHKMPLWMKFTRLFQPMVSTAFAAIHLHFRKKNALTKVAGLRLKTMLDVCHPRFSLCSRLLAGYLRRLPLHGKSLLDMGAGTGIIGILAAKKGAKVLAVDINPLAIQLTRENAIMHGLQDKIQCLQSDLFAGISSSQKFDYIAFNPPAFSGDLKNTTHSAPDAGKNGETIFRFFEQAKKFLSSEGKIILPLSSNMPLTQIDEMIRQHGFLFADCKRIVHIFEIFYILALQVA